MSYHVIPDISTFPSSRRLRGAFSFLKVCIFFPGITRKKTPKRRQSFPTLALARATRAPGATAPRPGDMASSSSDAHARRDAQRDALLAAPSPASEASYYAKLSAAAAASGAGHVRVERVTHGKGLVAARAFAKGERVLVEPPLVGMQQESNRADARVCGSCFRYVGSVGAQIARRLLAPAMRDAASAHGVDATWLRSLLRGDAALPEVAGFDARGLPSIVASPGDEDDEDAGVFGGAGGVLLRDVRVARVARARAVSERRPRHARRRRRRGVARVPGTRQGHERHIHPGGEGVAFGGGRSGREARTKRRGGAFGRE
jgi:hypothetical protein